MSKVNRRKFISAAVGGAIVAAAGYGYYEYSKKPTVITPTTQTTSTTTPGPKTTTPSPTMTPRPSTTQKPKLREGCPLVANYDHGHYEIKPEEIQSFSKWNILTLNFETAYYANSAIRQIRNLNPGIEILAWISLGFYKTPSGSGGVVEQSLLAGSTEDWWIHKKGAKTPSSRLHPVPWYPELATPNPKSDFASKIVKFLHESVLSTGLYDGVFFDVTWDNGWLTSVLSDADISIIDWREGVTNIMKATRENEGDDVIIIGNPGAEWRNDSSYWQYANGHYQENALGDAFGSKWDKMWEIYQRNMNKPSPPPRIHWIGVDTQYKRNRENYQYAIPTDDDLRRMRLGLGTTLLLDNGYFGFDKGDGWHGHGKSWWYPEYDAELGRPTQKYAKEGQLYKRVFENGLIIVNPSGSNSKIQTKGTYRDVSTGIEGTEFTVNPYDARILLEK